MDIDCPQPNGICQDGVCKIHCTDNRPCGPSQLVCNTRKSICEEPDCFGNQQCQYNEVCELNRCVPNNPCGDDNDCMRIYSSILVTNEGETLSITKCIREDCTQTCPCKPGIQFCVEKVCFNYIYCTGDYMCRNGKYQQICYQGYCTPIVCENDAVCGGGYFCHRLTYTNSGQGLCRVTFKKNQTSSCIDYSSCPAGQKCDKKLKICVDTRGPVGCRYSDTRGNCLDYCNQDYDCPKGYTCKKKVCTAPSCKGENCDQIKCYSDQDCPGALICDTRLEVCTPPPCFSDSNCRKGFICQNSQCEFPPGCRTDSECDKKELCVTVGDRRVCMNCDKNPACRPCKRIMDCAWDETCATFSINPPLQFCERHVDRECWFHSQCRGNEKCDLYTRTCVSISWCMSDAECPHGFCDPQARVCIDLPPACPAHYVLENKPDIQCLLKCKDDTQCQKYAGVFYKCKSNFCEPPSCKDKNNCPPGTSCSKAGVCVVVPNEKNNCSKSEECGFGGACVSTMEGEDKPDKSATCMKVCYNDGMCRNNQRCLFGACWDQCFSCKKGYSCKHNVCMRNPEECTKFKGFQVKDGICYPLIYCQEDANCPKFSKCDQKQSKCIPEPPTNTTQVKDCISKKDCLVLAKCQNDYCECLFGKCLQDCRQTICKDRTICVKYKGLEVCVPDEPGPPERCFVEGMLVRDGKCQFPQCVSHTDCKDQICLFGECVTTQISCFDNSPCPPGSVCRYGQCFVERRICVTDSNCQLFSDSFCNLGFCVPKIYKGCPAGMTPGQDGYCRVKNCKDSSQCGIAEICAKGQTDITGICINGVSDPPPPNRECSNGEFKVNNKCTKLQCLEDSHCPYEFYCRLGFCVSRQPDCSSIIRHVLLQYRSAFF